MTFDELLVQRDWKPIRNCPGRFILQGVPPDLSPRAVAGGAAELSEFSVEGVRDKVVVARLNEGGVISYKRADGTYLHTLNNAEGFTRKLRELGILLDD
jgi:hypothetical protein